MARKTRAVVVVTFGALALASGVCRAAEEAAPQPLELAAALQQAVENNPSIVRLRLEGAKLAETLAAVRTRRLPGFQVNVLASQQLRDVDFLFRRGVFGALPGIGPVPAADASIVTGKVPTALINAQIVQPLSQQHVIGLNLRQIELQMQANEEKLKAERQKVASEVKKAYYGVLLAQNGLTATRQGIELYREIHRVTQEHVVQKVALQSDRLDVETRQAKTEYDALVLEDQLAIQKQQLNLLLGRAIDTPFSVTPVGEVGREVVELAELRRRALEQRPEIREADIRTRQAEMDRRIKRAERIPEVGLALSYFSPLNFNEMLPTHVTSVGLLFKWDVYDWGRRKRELAEKGLTIEQARTGVEEARSMVLIDVEAKYRKLQQTKQLLRIAQLGRERANENVRVASNKYRQEFALLKDVLQAQTDLEQARFQQEQALLAYWTARADLEKAVGEEK
ncbi:MAG: TolC family protein [Acidobacteria bacterium]|nr:MAG: TolC family protein [Acidobacteriota bacterium]